MLGTILAQRNQSVLALHRDLAAAGTAVNIKSLYRLANDSPVQKIDLQIAAAICRACHVSLGELISFEKPKAQLHHLDRKSQSRLETLMEKSNEGQLTAAERKEFAQLAERAHRISMQNARLLLAERRRASGSIRRKGKPAGARATAAAIA
jgi:DNA-binding Xre family transcriptional regulator